MGSQLLQLLLKASQDKRFVCEEADKALSAMVGSMTPLPLLNKLRVYVSHANFRIRAKAAISISNCVSKMVSLAIYNSFLSGNLCCLQDVNMKSDANCVWSNEQVLEGMKEFGLVELVQMSADLLKDRLPEAREAARSVVISIYEAFTESEEQKQEAWQSFCQSNLSPIHAQSMFKIIPSL